MCVSAHSSARMCLPGGGVCLWCMCVACADASAGVSSSSFYARMIAMLPLSQQRGLVRLPPSGAAVIATAYALIGVGTCAMYYAVRLSDL